MSQASSTVRIAWAVVYLRLEFELRFLQNPLRLSILLVQLGCIANSHYSRQA
jgi:hypothetical protein